MSKYNKIRWSENDKKEGILNSGIFGEHAENRTIDKLENNIFFNIYNP